MKTIIKIHAYSYCRKCFMHHVCTPPLTLKYCDQCKLLPDIFVVVNTRV